MGQTTGKGKKMKQREDKTLAYNDASKAADEEPQKPLSQKVDSDSDSDYEVLSCFLFSVEERLKVKDFIFLHFRVR